MKPTEIARYVGTRREGRRRAGRAAESGCEEPPRRLRWRTGLETNWPGAFQGVWVMRLGKTDCPQPEADGAGRSPVRESPVGSEDGGRRVPPLVSCPDGRILVQGCLCSQDMGRHHTLRRFRIRSRGCCICNLSVNQRLFPFFLNDKVLHISVMDVVAVCHPRGFL